MTFRNFHWLDLAKCGVTLLQQIIGGIDIDLFHKIPVVTLNFKISLNAPILYV